MAEQLVNEFTVNRPIDEAWSVITDVERIAPCLPGAQLQEIAEEPDGSAIYRGVVKIKLGSITPSFKGQASFLERDDVARRAVLKADGRDTGGRGNASAEIAAHAEELSPTSTRVTVATDLHITGKVAQFGRGIIGDVSKKLMTQFASNLNEMLDEHPSSQSAKADATDDAPDDATVAADTGAASRTSPNTSGGTGADDDTAPTARADATPRDAGDDTATAADESRVRKIDAPATEPVDLAGVAGPAVLKRAAPLLALLIVLLLVLRRRR